MRACVVKLIAFEINLRAACIFSQALSEIERAWTANIVIKKFIEFCKEARVSFGFAVSFFQLKDRRHQGLGDITPTKITKTSIFVRRCYIFRLTHNYILIVRNHS